MPLIKPDCSANRAAAACQNVLAPKILIFPFSCTVKMQNKKSFSFERNQRKILFFAKLLFMTDYGVSTADCRANLGPIL